MASKCNIQAIQLFQNKYLRSVVGAGWYRNSEIHEYLQVKKVEDETTDRNKNYIKRLNEHQNNLVIGVQLFDKSRTLRRLKRRHVLDLR